MTIVPRWYFKNNSEMSYEGYLEFPFELFENIASLSSLQFPWTRIFTFDAHL